MIDFDKFAKYSKAGPKADRNIQQLLSFIKVLHVKAMKKFQRIKTRAVNSFVLSSSLCRSACYFCGCNVVYTSKEDKKERYIDYLERELELLSHHLDVSREVIQLHFGGGTPTFFNEAQLERILKAIKTYFKHFSHDAEISCEIDPI